MFILLVFHILLGNFDYDDTPTCLLPRTTHQARGGLRPDPIISWREVLLINESFSNCKHKCRLFIEPTWVLDSGNYTFSCSLTQRNMSSNGPPNVLSPPNNDEDKQVHLSAIGIDLFQGCKDKEKRGESPVGARG